MYRGRVRLVHFAVALAVVCFACLIAPARAAQPFNRDVLGLFDSNTETSASESRLHRWLEMPLNHLGYKLTLYDIAKGLPPVSEAKRYHAVATWFSESVPNATAYFKWARSVARARVRFVILDSVGDLGEPTRLPLINAFLGELGLAYNDFYVSDTTQSRIAQSAPGLVDFEYHLDPYKLPAHQVVTVKSPKTKIHLSVTDPAHKSVGATSSAIITTSLRGGLIVTGYAVHYNDVTDLAQWIVDPFKFLAMALGYEGWPIPDTTTESGRRLYFSHIDGDGWNNSSEVEPYASEEALAAEVMLDTLIGPYPDLPVSVGLIGGDADPEFGGLKSAGGIARTIFALPQVEVASHTYTHPYNWEFFANYRRDLEIDEVANFSNDAGAYEDRSVAALAENWREQQKNDDHVAVRTMLKTSSNDAALSRARPHKPFDLDLEVEGALSASSRFAPAGKQARLYLWSGNTRPFEAAIKTVRRAGVRNLNGGDSRFDSAFPSALYVAPLSRTVGGERQIYAVNSNENTYTNGWTGPFDAFSQLTETLDNTELPRRLKGFNLYYHSFSATKQLGLDVIISHLEKARRSRLAPITSSHYAGIAEGFFSTRIIPAGRDRWRITERGELNTVRFDDADAQQVDFSASRGVIGQNRHGEALYVALDAAFDAPLIVMRKHASDDRNEVANDVHLVDSRWRLSDVSRSQCDIRAKAEGFGTGQMMWAGVHPGAYTVSAFRNGEAVSVQTATAAADGVLEIEVAASAIDPVDLRITCR